MLKNPFSEQNTIHNQMRELNLDVQGYLFKKNIETSFYERRSWRGKNTIYYMDAISDIDVLAGFLMIIRESDITGMWYSYTESKWFILGVFLRLSYFSPFNVVADQLYNVIDELFIGRRNPLAINYKKYFSNELYLPPPHIKSIEAMHDKLSSILQRARHHGLEEIDKQSQLRFLYWVFIFGIEKTYQTLNLIDQNAESQSFIIELMSAYKSTSIKKHLPSNHVLTAKRKSRSLAAELDSLQWPKVIVRVFNLWIYKKMRIMSIG